MERILQDMVPILRDLCNCNLTQSDFSNTSMKCNEGGSNSGFLNTTLTYSSDTGDEIATTIAHKLYAEALVSSLKIENDILIESVIFSNNSLQVPLKDESGQSSATAGIAVGSFMGGVILAVICLGIIVILYCVRYVS